MELKANEYFMKFNRRTRDVLRCIIDTGMKNHISNVHLFQLNQNNHESGSYSVNEWVIDSEAAGTVWDSFEAACNNDKYFGYYWAEFDYDRNGGKNRYRLNMFFRALDYGSLNIHIFPGAIQFFAANEGNEEPYPYIDGNIAYFGNKDLINAVYISQNGSATYNEKNWRPLAEAATSDKDIPMLWSYETRYDLSEKIWDAGLDVCKMGEYLSTIKTDEKRQPVNIKQFYSMDDSSGGFTNGFCENWEECVYPDRETHGTTHYNTAYYLFKFKTDKKNMIQKLAYKPVSLGEYGHFIIFDGRIHEFSLKQKTEESEKTGFDAKNGKYKHFLSGPNYVCDRESCKVRFAYEQHEKIEKIIQTVP